MPTLGPTGIYMHSQDVAITTTQAHEYIKQHWTEKLLQFSTIIIIMTVFYSVHIICYILTQQRLDIASSTILVGS